MSAKYCNDPDACEYSDCPTAFCDRETKRSLPASGGSMGDTPRTDANEKREHMAYDRLWSDFARQLERDLNKAMAALNAVSEFVEEDYIEDCATPEYARAVKMMRAVQESQNEPALPEAGRIPTPTP